MGTVDYFILDGAGPASAGPATGDAICPFCGCGFEGGEDAAFCDDCELSDCVFCGVTTHRPLLSDNLACRACEGGDPE